MEFGRTRSLARCTVLGVSVASALEDLELTLESSIRSGNSASTGEEEFVVGILLSTKETSSAG